MKKNILLTGFLAGALVFGWSVQTQAMKRKREDREQENKQENIDYLDQILDPAEEEKGQARVLNKRRKTEEPTTQQNSGTNSGAQFNPSFVPSDYFQQNLSSLVPEENNTGFLNFLKSVPGRLRDGLKDFFVNRQANQQVNNQQVNQQQVNQQPTVPYDMQAFQDACNGVKNLAGRNLRGAPLAGRNLEDVDFTGADLTEADLRGANLNRVRLVNTILPRAHLERLDERQTRMEDAFIFKSNMSGAHLEGSFLNRSKIIDTNFSGAFFADAEINDALLMSTVFSGPVVGISYGSTGSGIYFYKGLRISVCEGTIAFDAGLRDGDEILEIDGEKVDENDSLATFGKKLNGLLGRSVHLVVNRKGTRYNFDIECRNFSYLAKIFDVYASIFTKIEMFLLVEAIAFIISVDSPLFGLVASPKTDLSGAHFDNTRLNRTIIAGVDLSHTTFTGMTLENTKILDSNLQNITLNRIRAEGVMILNCNASHDINRNPTTFQDVTFSNNSKIYNTNFSFARITRSREGDMEGEGLSFIDSSLEYVNMREIVSSKMVFNGTELSDIDFRAAYLNNLTMLNPPLYRDRGVSLFGFNLNFERARIMNAKFIGDKAIEKSRTFGGIGEVSFLTDVGFKVVNWATKQIRFLRENSKIADIASSASVIGEYATSFINCNFRKALLGASFFGHILFIDCNGFDDSGKNGVSLAEHCLFSSCEIMEKPKKIVSKEYLKLRGAMFNGYYHSSHSKFWNDVNETNFFEKIVEWGLRNLPSLKS